LLFAVAVPVNINASRAFNSYGLWFADELQTAPRPFEMDERGLTIKRRKLKTARRKKYCHKINGGGVFSV
jgi:hypothetical protein